MAAALTAGLALEKAVGGVDALAHPIKAELGPGVLHGELHAPLMAAMADFNTEAVGDRYVTMAEAFAKATREPCFSTEIGVFARAIGMPTSLREIGIDSVPVRPICGDGRERPRSPCQSQTADARRLPSHPRGCLVSTNRKHLVRGKRDAATEAICLLPPPALLISLSTTAHKDGRGGNR